LEGQDREEKRIRVEGGVGRRDGDGLSMKEESKETRVREKGSKEEDGSMEVGREHGG
jgi:hypothetical protein